MIKFKDLARAELIEDVNILANAVRTTLGPCGNNVIIHDNLTKVTKVTKDGVSVARAIKDICKKPAMNIIQEVSERTAISAGDGTTSSTIFAHALIKYLFKYYKSHNLLNIKKELDKLKDIAVEYLNKISIECDSQYIYNIANISSNNDNDIANTVVDIVNKTGKYGMISFQPSEFTNTVVKYSEGLKWNVGWLSQHFINNSDKLECEFTNAYVEIITDKISSLKKESRLVKLMEASIKEDIPLVIAVRDIEYDTLNSIIYNKLNTGLKCCIIKIPGHSDYQSEYIEDLKAIIGTSSLIDKIIITKTSTFFINNKDNEESKSNRIKLLQHRLTLPDENLEDLQNRITNINNSYATVYVGGNSEIEIKEKIDRFEDAICAVKSALDEGIVIGGGNTLIKISNYIKSLQGDENIDTNLAKDIFIKSCLSISEQLVANSRGIENYEYGDINIQEFIDSQTSSDEIKYLIYKDNVFTTCSNPLECGLIDPTKVIRLIIENGVSVAGTLITTNCLIKNDEDYQRRNYDEQY